VKAACCWSGVWDHWDIVCCWQRVSGRHPCRASERLQYCREPPAGSSQVPVQGRRAPVSALGGAKLRFGRQLPGCRWCPEVSLFHGAVGPLYWRLGWAEIGLSQTVVAINVLAAVGCIVVFGPVFGRWRMAMNDGGNVHSPCGEGDVPSTTVICVFFQEAAAPLRVVVPRPAIGVTRWRWVVRRPVLLAWRWGRRLRCSAPDHGGYRCDG